MMKDPPDHSWLFETEQRPQSRFSRFKENWHNYHHLYEAWFWALMVVPAYLWFKDSVWFVIIVSLYANYKTAISAHEGRQARRNTENNNENP